MRPRCLSIRWHVCLFVGLGVHCCGSVLSLSGQGLVQPANAPATFLQVVSYKGL